MRFNRNLLAPSTAGFNLKLRAIALSLALSPVYGCSSHPVALQVSPPADPSTYWKYIAERKQYQYFDSDGASRAYVTLVEGLWSTAIACGPTSQTARISLTGDGSMMYFSSSSYDTLEHAERAVEKSCAGQKAK